MSSAEIYIGTSGWHYDHWWNTFYPENIHKNKRLEYYYSQFDTLELNNSFYHLPKLKTFENWRERTLDHFVFAVKATRYITHMKKLHDVTEPVRNMLEQIDGLGNQTGPILFQLPPRFNYNAERLKNFLGILPQKYRYTLEFRTLNWINDDSLDQLKRKNIAFCIYQLAGYTTPIHITADFVYIRLHGPTERKYEGSYSDAQLADWAERIKAWRSDGKDVYCYFDNDQSGYAPKNALTLRGMLG